jgi:hypothetical protein
MKISQEFPGRFFKASDIRGRVTYTIRDGYPGTAAGQERPRRQTGTLV